MKDTTKLMVIIEESCKFYGVKIEQIIPKGNKRIFVEPRQVISYYANRYTNLSLKEIGRFIGRDHATVLHGQRLIRNLIKVNGYGEKLFPLSDQIEKRIKLINSNEGNCPYCKQPMP